MSQFVKDEQQTVPVLVYSDECMALSKAIHEFVNDNPEYNLKNYTEIIEKHIIDTRKVPLDEVDVTKMDETGVLALLVAAVRYERFCDGFYLNMLESGAVLRWLKRLEVIDREK